jgi:deoxyribodipyrimidine photolyase-like uncharacterized protein
MQVEAVYSFKMFAHLLQAARRHNKKKINVIFAAMKAFSCYVINICLTVANVDVVDTTPETHCVEYFSDMW